MSVEAAFTGHLVLTSLHVGALAEIPRRFRLCRFIRIPRLSSAILRSHGTDRQEDYLSTPSIFRRCM